MWGHHLVQLQPSAPLFIVSAYLNMRRFNHIQKSPRLLKQYLVGGFNPSEKYEFVSWDDEIPNIWKVIKAMFQTTKPY